MTILRRIAVALKRQDWATVLIEFALVILGVLIALQLNNWNEARQDRIDERTILVRLHEEGDVRPRFRCDKLKWSQSPRVLTVIMLNADITDAFMRYLSPWAEQMIKVHELVDGALEIHHDMAINKDQP